MLNLLPEVVELKTPLPSGMPTFVIQQHLEGHKVKKTGLYRFLLTAMYNCRTAVKNIKHFKERQDIR
ncbi:hypothetical protein XELAEV_18047518mg [Xenopus laevis]|uniref:Uncharacterized protein n=1 Tax=Xenopus laevis TaxID=8355 RepID=A0A974BVI7_XENLA|nr:hypothetical protein XELAEV_18047518mg [Xenopus laevis]